MRRTIVPVVLSLSLVAGAVSSEEATFAVRLMTPETALKAAQAALKSCRDRGFQATVAVVDRMGVVQVLLRDRFAGPHTVATAINKGWTAISLRTDTLEFAKATATGGSAGIRHLPNVVAVGGGVNIQAGGATVGAIGVSGAPTGEADEACAKAGIAAIRDELEF
jgi:uncharacterized protein GlcG (DUF336 family)